MKVTLIRITAALVLGAPLLLTGNATAQDESLQGSIESVSGIFNWDEAMELLEALDPYYRVRGNDGYVQGLQRIFVLLSSAGFAERNETQDWIEFRDLGPPRPAWTPASASLSVVAPDEIELHAFSDPKDIDRTFVCPNSFPTPPDGINGPVVRYEHGRPVETYAGTIVFGHLPVEDLFERAVEEGGALGVISSYLGDYNRPDEHPDAIRYAHIPYNAERRGFGLNISKRKGELLDRLLASGMVYVRVKIRARFTTARARTLLAQIAGTEPATGTVVVYTTADEPGANDNGSGMVATTAIAAGYLRAIREGLIDRPRRSITFLFGPEIEGSREWLHTRPGKVDLALVIDMVGQDQAVTGATALVERMPDPGAIWDRPPLDVHSDWGRGDVRESDLMGSFLNDYVMAAMSFRAAETDWNVRSNPYEGGSDQGEFLERGIPSVLLWHFTDPFYHTNLDRTDKVSQEEMANVAAAALGLVHHFAHAGRERAEEVLDIVMAAARKRLSIEANNAAGFLEVPAVRDDPTQRAAVTNRERHILLGWSRWYRQAVLSIESFDPALSPGDREALQARIDASLKELREIEREVLEGIEPAGG